jgi:hypothetical protein
MMGDEGGEMHPISAAFSHQNHIIIIQTTADWTLFRLNLSSHCIEKYNVFQIVCKTIQKR